jgi:hypothetical protein
MATGRIGVTPVLRVRWSDQPTTGTTVLSGLDDNSVALVYDAGYEAVYRNGVLLSRGNDYTATNGTTITLIDATLAGDIIEVFANDLVPLTDAISKGQYTAKGALLSASAASTPGVLTVGANGTVLTADSAETTGLKWATPAAGGMTLLSTTTLNATTINITGISQDYKKLVGFIKNARPSTSANYNLRYNNISSATYSNTRFGSTSVNQVSAPADTGISLCPDIRNVASTGFIVFEINDYANTTTLKLVTIYGFGENNSVPGEYSIKAAVAFSSATSAISELNIYVTGGGSQTSGTLELYGVK